jgi:hypothetical protein
VERNVWKKLDRKCGRTRFAKVRRGMERNVWKRLDRKVGDKWKRTYGKN